MRGDPDGPPCAQAALRMGLTQCIGGRCARACSSSGISIGLINQSENAPGDVWRGLDKVMAGGTPANPAALVLTVGTSSAENSLRTLLSVGPRTLRTEGRTRSPASMSPPGLHSIQQPRRGLTALPLRRFQRPAQRLRRWL